MAWIDTCNAQERISRTEDQWPPPASIGFRGNLLGAFLRRTDATAPVSEFVTRNHEGKCKDGEKRSDAEDPPDANLDFPHCKEEREGDPKSGTVEPHNGRGLDKIPGEAFDFVVYDDGDIDVGGEEDQESSKDGGQWLGWGRGMRLWCREL